MRGHQTHLGARSGHRLPGLDVVLPCLLLATIGLVIFPGIANAAVHYRLSGIEAPRALCTASPPLNECNLVEVPTVPATSGEGVGPDLPGEGVGGGLAPKELREAYALPATGGAGVTVAIVDPYNDPKTESDLNAYRKEYGLDYEGASTTCSRSNSCFSKINQTGGSSTNEEDTIYPESQWEWAAEISLDLDMVAAACPECKLLLVEATTSSDSNLDAAEAQAYSKHAAVISNSWGRAEYEGETTRDTYFNHPGVPITFASGDIGYGTEYPSASSHVIDVGGTKLTKEGAKWAQEVWRTLEYEKEGKKVKVHLGEKPAGTGSGCSKWEAKPSWQTGLGGCEGRVNNDVAAVAAYESPVSVYDSYHYSGWVVASGTSAASPLIAGVEAL